MSTKAKLGREDSLVNIDKKPDPGCAFKVIDHSSSKKMNVRMSITCRRDTNNEKDGTLQSLFKTARGSDDPKIVQLSRYVSVREPYFTAKLGRKGDFIPITFLVGVHHKKCVGFAGLPTKKAIAKAIKNPDLLCYEWTATKHVDAVAAGDKMYEVTDGDYIEIVETPKAAKKAVKKEAKKAVVVKAKAKAKAKVIAKKTKAKKAPVAKAAKGASAKKQTWYKAKIDNTVMRKNQIKQPEGYFSTQVEARKNKPVLKL